jgi:putative ATP-dependent endonuclease of OLD family
VKIRRVDIHGFRGIRTLEWTIGGDCACLIGPGDSTKTTILDAIELVLSPRWNVQFDDTDFFEANIEEPFTIAVTVGDLPNDFKSDAKFGYVTRGWTTAGELRDEPGDDDELVLTIELRVDQSLEPTWVVINDRSPDGREIGRRDRDRVGCVRLTDYVDRQLSWSRGSALSRLTGKTESLTGILADAARAARQAISSLGSSEMASLSSAAQRAKSAGADFGVTARGDFRPQLDVQAASLTSGGLSLHDNGIPLRRAGLGTRRLLSIAMQREAAKSGGICLLDEVEHGLEPHRIRHLVRLLRDEREGDTRSQVLMTTHAPVVIEELDAQHLRVVRSSNGFTQVLAVDAALQPTVRKAAGAFLARKILVCEGKTELGLGRRLDEWWTEEGTSFSYCGVALVDGGGAAAPAVAAALASLDYDVALLGDSDQPLKPSEIELTAAGVELIQWDGGMALEERIAQDLPWAGVAEMIKFATEEYGEQSVTDAVTCRLGDSPSNLSGSPEGWLDSGIAETVLRTAVGRAAKEHKVVNRRGWFKRVDLAEGLGDIVVRYHDRLAATDLGRKIAALKTWSQSDG